MSYWQYDWLPYRPKTLKLDPPKSQEGCTGVYGGVMYRVDQGR